MSQLRAIVIEVKDEENALNATYPKPGLHGF